MRARALLATVAVLAAPLVASAEPADPFVRMSTADDVVVLRGGTVLRGRVVERVEDDHVTVRTADGRLVRVRWLDVEPPAQVRVGKDADMLPVLAVGAGLGILAGAGLLIASLPVHDQGTRKDLQISGGVTLAVGGALGVVVLIVGLGRAAPAFGAGH